MEQLILRHVVDDMKSLRSIESSTFRAIIHAAVPDLNMSRQALGTKLQIQLDKTKLSIVEKLKGISYVSTTADIWSSRQRSYLGVTCHWIDPDKLTRCSVVLGFRRFTGQHNFQRIATMLNGIHMEFQLDTTKITYVITDNGSNFLKAFREFGVSSNINNDDTGEELSEDDEVAANESITDINLAAILDSLPAVTDDEDDEANTSIPYLPKHVSCVAHTLNLLTTKDTEASLEDSSYKTLYRSTTAKCTALTNAIHRSSQASEDAQEIIGRTIPKPNSTRWNSQYDSLETISKVSANVNRLMEKLKLPKFKSNELEFLAEWGRVMQPLAVALDLLQGENNTEAFFGAILPTVMSLRKKLDAAAAADDIKHCKPLVKALQQGLENRFPNLLSFDSALNGGQQYIVAAVCHPFFKLRWLNENDKSAAEELFLKALKSNSATTTVSDCVGDNSTSDTETHAAAGAGSEGHDFFGFSVASESSAGQNRQRQLLQACRNEGLSYLQSPVHTSDLSMLQQYPLVAKLFCKTNAATPSSAPVERLFSCAGLIFVPRRNRLSDEKFEQLLFLKKNYPFVKF